jgi:hypothetical protein
MYLAIVNHPAVAVYVENSYLAESIPVSRPATTELVSLRTKLVHKYVLELEIIAVTHVNKNVTKVLVLRANHAPPELKHLVTAVKILWK